MAIRSTTSANQPPPPFYGGHASGRAHMVNRASPTLPGATNPIGIPVILGRDIDPVLTSTLTPAQKAAAEALAPTKVVTHLSFHTSHVCELCRI